MKKRTSTLKSAGRFQVIDNDEKLNLIGKKLNLYNLKDIYYAVWKKA